MKNTFLGAASKSTVRAERSAAVTPAVTEGGVTVRLDNQTRPRCSHSRGVFFNSQLSEVGMFVDSSCLTCSQKDLSANLTHDPGEEHM